PVLDELIDLTVAVAAFLDVAFGVRVLLDESGIDPVRLQYARGLLVDELQYGGPLGAHCATHLALIRMRQGGECVLLTQTGERGDRTGSARRSWPAARPLNGSSRTSPNHVPSRFFSCTSCWFAGLADSSCTAREECDVGQKTPCFSGTRMSAS